MDKTAGEVVTEIKMLRTVNVRSSILIVEGVTDVKFWRTRVSTSCEVVYATCKAVGLSTVHKLSNINFTGYVGIFDRDYDDLAAPSTIRANIIFWGAHSVESVLFHSGATARVIAEKIPSARIEAVMSQTGSTLISHIETIALAIGQMRYLQSNQGIRENRDALSPFEHVTHGNNLTFDPMTLYQSAVAMRVIPSVQQAKAYIEKYVPNCAPRLLTRGHDLTALLSIAIGDSNHSCGVKDAEGYLRLAFYDTDLIATQAYQDIRAWEKINSPFRILN